MKYKIVTGSNTRVLKYKVEEEIANRWVPQGGVAIAVSPDTINTTLLVIQAMVKEEDDTTN